MNKPVKVINLDCVGGDLVLVHFSDGTHAAYTAEELADFKPGRQVEGSKEDDWER